jgi:hypothetical protein
LTHDCTERAPSTSNSGGWGLKIRCSKARSGPEATVSSFAFQLGRCLTAIGQHYDSINESVMIARHYVAAAWQHHCDIHFLLPMFASGAIIAGPIHHTEAPDELRRY